MKEFVAGVLLSLVAVVFGAMNLALGWYAFGATDLDLPSIGGVGEYLAASAGILLVGEVLTTGIKMKAALDDR